MDGDAAGVGESVSIRRTRALLLNVELCVRFLWVIEEKSEKMRQWEGLSFSFQGTLPLIKRRSGCYVQNIKFCCIFNWAFSNEWGSRYCK